MKVLSVSPYFHPQVGGLESVALAVAQGLARAGHELVIVTSGTPSAADADVEGLRVLRLPASLRVSNTPLGLRWWPTMRRLLAVEEPDVILAHTPVPGLADVAYLAKAPATPFVVFYHAGSMAKGASVLNPAIRTYERRVFGRWGRGIDLALGPYPEFLRGVLGDGVEIRHTPPGIDLDLFVPPPAPAPRPVDVLFVGRLERTSGWKGVGSLLAACALVARDRPDLRVRIVGDGDARADHQAAADALGLGRTVEFTGLARSRELVSHYQAAKVAVLASESDAEAFGMVLIEALACGAAVIGSRIGGIPRALDGGRVGTLVPPSDPPALGRAILGVLEAGGPSAVGAAAARAYVEANFSQERLVSAVADALESVVARRRRLVASAAA